MSTWGILSAESHRTIRDWIEQLVGQGYLAKEGEYNVMRVTPEGRQLLKGKAVPKLLAPARKERRRERRIVDDSGTASTGDCSAAARAAAGTGR